MLKKTLQAFMLTMLIAFMTLFTAAHVMAQEGCTVPLSCTTENGWTVELMEGYPNQIGADLYDWKYSVKNENLNTKGLNHINFSLPVCCPDPIPILYSEPAVHQWPPGIPDDTTGFGKGILEIFVLKWSLNDPQDNDWHFHTNTEKISKGTVGLKVGKKLEVCEIAVPGCADPAPELAQAAVTTMSFVTTNDGRDFMIDEDPYTQCINWVYEKVPCMSGVACRPNDLDNCKYDVPVEDCADGWYWFPLDKVPSSEVLTATSAGGGEPVTDVATQTPCGRAIVKAGDNTFWFFLMFGWAFF